MRDAAEAAATLVRQVEAHKALTAAGEAQHIAPPPDTVGDESTFAPPQADARQGSRKRRGSKKKPFTESVPPTT